MVDTAKNTTVNRFTDAQRNRTLFHHSLIQPTTNLSSTEFFCQPCEKEHHSPTHRFVICADTQYGIITNNVNWDMEMQYSTDAVNMINKMIPAPAFVCVCGDLVDMEYTFEAKKGDKSNFTSQEDCDAIQDQQNVDFKRIWSNIDPQIALVCLCGNHDVGNRPTPRSISRFRDAFGDEYLAFWTNGSYNIVLNNVLYVDPSGAEDMFNTQHQWLENCLQYANDEHATNIFVFAHHPWFLYDEFENPADLLGYSPYPDEWQPNDGTFPDSYFSMNLVHREKALELFRRYNVTACFSGHFHQNLISKTSWGMDMIITSSLSVVFDSTGKNKHNNRMSTKDGFDIVALRSHRQKIAYGMDVDDAMMSSTDKEMSFEPNCRGLRVVDAQGRNRFRHFFVPL
jgi:hypothetical protein